MKAGLYYESTCLKIRVAEEYLYRNSYISSTILWDKRTSPFIAFCKLRFVVHQYVWNLKLLEKCRCRFRTLDLNDLCDMVYGIYGEKHFIASCKPQK
jgi:hypothetical protein